MGADLIVVLLKILPCPWIILVDHIVHILKANVMIIACEGVRLVDAF